MPATPPPHDDGFDDDPAFVNDRFGDPVDPYATGSADPYAADPYANDPYVAEAVIVEDPQNVPSSYNVRNIVLLASGLTLLLFAALIWSLSRSDDPQMARDEQNRQDALDQTTGATAPDAILTAQGAPADDLSALLNDPNVANGGPGGYGAYSEPAAPQTYSSYSEPAPAAPAPTPEVATVSDGGGGFSGPREPTYYDRRREAYYAALGLGSRESIGEQPGTAGYGQAGYGSAGQGDLYGAGGGQGDVSPGSLTLAGASGAGARQPAGQNAGQGGGQSTGQSARRAGPPSLPPNSSYRQAGTSANAPFAPFTLAQGTLIPVVLETAVNSELEGVFIARTVEDVYDRTRRHVLIPRGSQVVSSYANAEAIGDRLQAAANRLNLPDGRSVDFSDTGVFDLQGRSGLRDRVNRHTASRLSAGALLTIVGVASAVGQRRASRDVILVPNADGSVTQVPVGDDIRNEAISRGTQGAQQAISERATRIINRPNTIILRPGLRGTLILQQDVDMRRPYYDDGGAVPRGPSPFDTRRPRPSPRPAQR